MEYTLLIFLLPFIFLQPYSHSSNNCTILKNLLPNYLNGRSGMNPNCALCQTKQETQKDFSLNSKFARSNPPFTYVIV